MNRRKPLEGINILDFSTVVMGPVATRHLADAGATVVKIESFSRPDTTRTSTPYKGGEPGLNRGGYFAAYNASKLSLGLNMSKPGAVEFVRRRLIPWADVVIEAFTPRVMEQWGLGYEALKKIRPDIIMLSACLLGRGGPHAAMRGFGQLAAALSGWYDLTGWPDRAPVGPYSAYSDFISWNYCMVAILAALDYRRRTGKGQHIDQSMYESTLQFCAPALLDYWVNGHQLTRAGNRDSYAVPHGAYRCRGEDRWCAIAVATDKEWRALCRAMGRPELASDPRFATVLARKEREDELDALVEAWSVTLDPHELMRLLQEAGVPAGVVQNAEDLFQDPQLRYRGHFFTVDHPEMGEHYVPTTSFHLSGADTSPTSAAPCLGQHTEYVCKGLLGMSDGEIGDLIAAEVLEVG